MPHARRPRQVRLHRRRVLVVEDDDSFAEALRELLEADGRLEVPLAWTVTGGNRNDVTQLVPLIERVPPVRGKVGRPRRRPDRLIADRGYDHDKYRRELRARRIKPEIARRQHSSPIIDFTG